MPALHREITRRLLGCQLPHMGKMINIFPALSGEPTTMSRAPSTKRDEQYLAWLEELHSRCWLNSTLDYMFQRGRQRNTSASWCRYRMRLKSAVPSSRHATASPSMMQECARSRASASTMRGNR